MLSDFKKFVLRGNLVDLAIGFTVGAAFTTVAKSIVTDIIMPPVGLLLGRVDFEDLFWVLKAGEEPGPYPTIEVAQTAGAVTLNYGRFGNNVLALVLVAIVMFMIIRAVNRVEDLMEEEAGGGKPTPDEPSNKKCPYCRTQIPYRAVRCPQCTTELQGFDKVELPPKN